jgi:hypothetical protein
MSVFKNASPKVQSECQEYRDMIKKTLREWRPRIGAADNKRGWDNVFKQSVPSRREILQARDAVLQDIALEAKILGIDLKLMSDEEYVSPWDKEKA